MSSYVPNTDLQVKEMLGAIGVKAIDDLFAEIPAPVRLNRALNLPKGLSEPETLRQLSDLADQNLSSQEAVSFLGGGCYDHYIPSAVNHLLLRGDFFTAYTPYQAEISQGTLQAIYEFQSLMCALTGMDQANASMYEGGTALAEAVAMAQTQTGRHKILLPETVHPEYRRVVETLMPLLGAKLVTVPMEEGATDPARVAEKLDDQTAAVVVQYPNFFGRIE